MLRELDKAACYSVLALSPQFSNAVEVLAHRMQQRDGITAPILARAGQVRDGVRRRKYRAA